MLDIALIEVLFGGNTMQFRWTVTPEASVIGVAAARGVLNRRFGDDLGSPDGAQMVGAYLSSAAGRVAAEFEGAWSTPPLF